MNGGEWGAFQLLQKIDPVDIQSCYGLSETQSPLAMTSMPSYLVPYSSNACFS